MKRTIRVFSLLLAAVMLLSAQALATEPAQAFTDVSKQDYFYDAVNWAVEKEITSGVSKDVFAPNRDCTRADFVTFLWRATGKPVVNYAMNFSDVKESSYYTEAVRWAASLGIVTGLSKNTFGAANAVTREQAATMLWRFAKQQGFDTTQGGMAIREYADYDSLSEYAREAMAWAVNTEILKGANNRLLPDAACTRAQLVTLLYRLESQTTDKVDYSGDVTGWMYAPESKDTLVNLLESIDTVAHGSAGGSLQQANAAVSLMKLAMNESGKVEEAAKTYLAGMNATQKDFFSFQWQQAMKTALAETADAVGDTMALLRPATEKLLTSLESTIDDLEGLTTDEYMDTLVNILGGDPAVYGQYFPEMVQTSVNAVYPIANYGSAMTPFYTVLAIWVGGVILSSLIKIHARTEGLIDPKPAELYFGRYLFFFVLSQIQAAVIVTGDLYILKVQCLHPGMLYLTGALTAFTFSLLIYSLALSFGDVGKAIVVVIMVMQIAGSSGTFPIELLPAIYQKIYRFFPFPYAIDAMRECICGMYGNYYWQQIGFLLLFAAAALLIGLLVRRPFMGLNHFMEEKLEETELL